MKNSIKREQSQACLNFAERKNFRLKAKHKILMTLALLLTAVTGAWAQTETLLTTITATAKEQASYSTANVATVSFSYTAGGSSAYLANWGWWGYGWIATVTAAEGYTITKCIFYDDADRTATDSEAPFVVETTEEDKTPRINGTPIDGGNMQSKGIKKIEVYGYKSEPAIDVKWDPATKTGTFEMPAYDVEIAPIYAPVAQWAEVETVKQLPAAIEGIYAESTDAIVKAGTVAFAGTSTEVKQGTVMYAVTSTNEAPALTAFSADVPTAKEIKTAGDVYVWYYIKGADAPEGQTATAENTFNDSEICPEPITVTVLSNKFDIQFKAANANTIEAGKATVKVGDEAAEVKEGKLTGVKMNSKVTVTAKDGYKFRKVEAKKHEEVTYILLSAATAEDIGKVVCAAGHLHTAKTAVPSGCTAVGILGKVTSTGHGLILALKDAKDQNWNTINGWESKTTYAGTTLKLLPDDDARGTNLTSYTALGETTVSNWAVAQKSDYVPIFVNLGSTTGDSEGKTYDGNVNAYFTGVGGTERSNSYWSTTESDASHAWYFGGGCWDASNKSGSFSVWPVLGF